MTILAKGHLGVTPSDTVDLRTLMPVVAISDGNVSILDQYDTIIQYTGVLAGTVLPVLAKRVRATGTTATLAALII